MILKNIIDLGAGFLSLSFLGSKRKGLEPGIRQAGIGQHPTALGLTGDFFTWLSFISSANGDSNTNRVVVGLGVI